MKQSLYMHCAHQKHMKSNHLRYKHHAPVISLYMYCNKQKMIYNPILDDILEATR